MSASSCAVKLVYLLLLQVTITSSCAPGVGSGAIIGNPTLTFSVSPPLDWTYYSGAAITGHDPSQIFTTLAAAQAKVDADIDQAVSAAFYDWQITTPYTLTATIEDTNIPVLLTGTAITSTTAGQGFNIGGTVPIATTTTAAVTTIYSKKVTVTVTTPVKLPTTQWEIFGNNLLIALTINNNVIPRSRVMVTGTP